LPAVGFFSRKVEEKKALGGETFGVSEMGDRRAANFVGDGGGKRGAVFVLGQKRREKQGRIFPFWVYKKIRNGLGGGMGKKGPRLGALEGSGMLRESKKKCRPRAGGGGPTGSCHQGDGSSQSIIGGGQNASNKDRKWGARGQPLHEVSVFFVISFQEYTGRVEDRIRTLWGGGPEGRKKHFQTGLEIPPGLGPPIFFFLG